MRSGAEVFRFHGRKMVAVWARPEPERKAFPAVLFLHGFPGSEKNADIRRALLKRGVASLSLHFQGAWGSEGNYLFTRLIEQARAGWRFMAERPGVNPRRLGVFGFSMGGWTAIHLAAREGGVSAIAALAPVGGPEMDRGARTREKIKEGCRALRAPSPRALYLDFRRAVAENDPAESAALLKAPLLLVHGTADEMIPADVSRRIFKRASDPKRLVLLPGARHDCLDRRERLSRLVADWLARRLR